MSEERDISRYELIISIYENAVEPNGLYYSILAIFLARASFLVNSFSVFFFYLLDWRLRKK